MQEVITLTVFAVFSLVYLGQPIRWNYIAGFALIVAAVAVIFKSCRRHLQEMVRTRIKLRHAAQEVTTISAPSGRRTA
jgi:Ca2+/Na+ antiporter